MTRDIYIKNKTNTFKIGDMVVMHSCGESEFPQYKGKLWICRTNSYINESKNEVVFLEGYSGSFSVKYLQLVKI